MVACSTTAKNTNYVADYKSALAPQNLSDDLTHLDYADQFENLFELFANFKTGQLEEHIDRTYAQQLYFNDTLHTATNKTELAEYLRHGADNLVSIKVSFEDVSKSADNYYLRWLMEMHFKVMGKSIQTQSIGISQIRFDEDGKIVFHQDFWDNTNGFFGHLPVLGSIMSKIKHSMK